jgi:sodium/pantothenate symporter
LGAVLLYGGLLHAGGGMQIWERIPPAVTSMDGYSIPWMKTLGMAFSISLGLIALPDLLIMIFSAKDNRVLRFAGIYGPLSIAAYAFCIFSLGILAYGALSPAALQTFAKNPDSLVPYLATALLPPGLDGIILLAAISAAMSTISAIVLVTTTALTADILRFFQPSIADQRVLLLTRAMGVIILIAAACMAINVPQQIVPLVSVSMGVIACCVSVPLFFGLYWRRGTGTGFVASLLFSFGSVVMWQLYGNPLIHPVFIGLICGSIAYMGGSIATNHLRCAKEGSRADWRQ